MDRSAWIGLRETMPSRPFGVSAAKVPYIARACSDMMPKEPGGWEPLRHAVLYYIPDGAGRAADGIIRRAGRGGYPRLEERAFHGVLVTAPSFVVYGPNVRTPAVRWREGGHMRHGRFGAMFIRRVADGQDAVVLETALFAAPEDGGGAQCASPIVPVPSHAEWLSRDGWRPLRTGTDAVPRILLILASAAIEAADGGPPGPRRSAFGGAPRTAGERIETAGVTVRVVSVARPDRDGAEPAAPAGKGTAAHAAGGARREWSHRWSVRGHWTNQAYGPGRTLRRRIWIDEYVKGPKNKPLKARAVVLKA
ncbi:hypothetical protein [Bifidobacterium myosotis]|uniref:Uncharacterized protein n=1 Tax=Bifidobacterium myosotis TaxID=1630166 RepID=A0A5M9ZG69_9BIFI|nr:hypothetical protein [Bifidobacterium myosotis]KAA8825101.1 hypothetical protein EMO91_12800 [Bifidobacterium myosotis]